MTKQQENRAFVKMLKEFPKAFGRVSFRERLMLRTAFTYVIAGLKAGRPQWHKVADGDLPNTEREVLIFMWGSYYLGYYKQYDGEDRSWHFEDFDEESEQVIAWCEIPTFDKD